MAKVGRKSNYERVQRGELQKIASNYLLDNWDTFPPATKLKVSLKIVDKIIPDKVETHNTHQISQQQLNTQIADEIRQLRYSPNRIDHIDTTNNTLKELEE